MFYDERINAECGKIYRRGIICAVLFSVFYALVRMLVTEFSAKNYMAELFVSVCGIVILLIGLVRFYGGADERQESEKHAFYLNAGKFMIIAAISGYALTLPFVRGRNDFPVNHFILVLEMLGYMYFFYSFKSREINFNYTFIAEDKKTYYTNVCKNIGKLAAVLLLPFVIAAFLDYSVNGSFLRFWSVLNGYLFSVLGLGLEYLFISWVEKLSYEDESERLIKKGTLVAFLFWFALILMSEAISLYQVYVLEYIHEMQDIIGNIGEFVSELSYRQMYFSFAITAFSAVVLCHVMAAVPDMSKVKKSVRAYLILKVIAFLYSLFVNVPFRYIDALEIQTRNLVMDIHSTINFILFLLTALALSMGAHALWKEKKMPRVLMLLPLFPLIGDLIINIASTYQRTWVMACAVIACVLSVGGGALALVLFKKRDAKYLGD